MDGLLLVDKPKEWTSFDVVAKTRGMVKKETGLKRPKVGHTGTLDPLATGLLVLTIGKYCKRAQEFSKLDKVYEVEIKLGETSTTGDNEGEKTEVSSLEPSLSSVNHAVNSFVGNIMQTPPAFSAIKIDGKRAYELARAGKEVTIPPRPVTIYSITEIEYKYPKVTFTTKVSSGTYIRSLVEDIGKQLKTGAFMSGLRRSEVGNFSIRDAAKVDSLSPDRLKELLLNVSS